jgi:predicted CoA-binding protein
VHARRASKATCGEYDRRLEYRDDVTVIWMQAGIRDVAAARRAKLPAAVSFTVSV